MFGENACSAARPRGSMVGPPPSGNSGAAVAGVRRMTMDKTPPARPIQHIASEAALTQMENISRYFPVWPAVLPSKVNPALRPLAVGIDKDLIARMVVPPDTDVVEAETQVRRAIGFLTRSYPYCRAV